MIRCFRASCFIAALAIACCGSHRAAADPPADSAEVKAKLALVRGRIGALTQRLGSELRDRDVLGARLREADLRITAARRRLESLRGAELAAARRREELRAEDARIQRAQGAERSALASLVRAAYMIGGQARLKLLLNQNDPASAGRMLIFQAIFAKASAQRIAAIDVQVARVRELVAEIGATSATLRTLQNAASNEIADLRRAREERVAALAAVTRQMSSGNQELQRLKREAQAEESLLADLARVLQDFPVDVQQSFAGLRGKLPWPVPGRMTNAAASGVRKNGVLIESTRGAKVRAAYFGRVVYADWLPGLGLLLIIGHGDNYMSLYGHAEVLYKSVGDWVAPGDVIAALGDSGAAAPQLYFEIRAGRTPQDPAAWLQPAE